MIFFKRSAKSKYKDFSSVVVDIHSHLVPGVDDGARDIEDSLQLIAGLKELGFSKLFTTPHTLQDIHPNTHITLTNGYSLLEQCVPHDIELYLSSEYFIDELFSDQLKNGNLLPLPGKRLLIEFSQISRPHNLEEVIFDLGIRGYQAVLAHPERYLFFHKNFNYFTRLKDMGVEFQVNALSLTDHYGKNIRTVAEKLIEKNMIDFIGTDIHHIRHLEGLEKVPESKFFAQLIDSGHLKNSSL